MRFVALGMVAATLGCEAVVPIDLHYSDGGPLDVGQATDSPTMEDGQAIGPGGLCMCGDIDAGGEPNGSNGEGCCLPKGGGAPFCTSDGTDCAGSGGLFILCQSPTIDSVCCWSNLNASGSSAEMALAGTCGSRAQACGATTDCSGAATCELATCGGLTVGACGMTPSCP